jgi:CDP-glucose 4,6-dehydratase
VIDKGFWAGKKVFVTGHTGFKGSWLCLWLHLLGAKVSGYALNPPTTPSLYNLANINELLEKSYIADIRDQSQLTQALINERPEIVFHMAAQPLVRASYDEPVETYSTNIMGTINLLEAIRASDSVKAIVNITTDKCYENYEWHWGYRENDRLGGFDPYSSSKACAELITNAYRSSFFENDTTNYVALASARAGNVIGGGDWAKDRLIPDCLQALYNNKSILIRNPASIRPWQHVLEPLHGYLLLAENLYKNGREYSSAWNFGPDENDAKSVIWIVERLSELLHKEKSYVIDNTLQPHEARYLKLDCSKAKNALGWHQTWDLETTLTKIIDWTNEYHLNKDVREISFKQILEFSSN